MTIWDRGLYVTVKWGPDKITVVLAGERLNGRYELVKTDGDGENHWLLFKPEE